MVVVVVVVVPAGVDRIDGTDAVDWRVEEDGVAPPTVDAAAAAAVEASGAAAAGAYKVDEAASGVATEAGTGRDAANNALAPALPAAVVEEEL